MADKTGYIGRNPNDSAVTVARQFFTASGVTTAFTFASGYLTGYLDVYVDGVKKRVADEFTATDGSTFDVLQGGVGAGSTVEAVAYKAFNAAAVSGDITGNFDVSGNTTLGGSLGVTGGTTVTNLVVTGISTLGTGTTVGFANTAFNLGGTPNISVDLLSAVDINVSGAATIGGVLTYEDVTNIDSIGIVTARTGIEVTANGLVVNAGVGTFAADLSIADKLIHTGDTNTSIRFPSADTITAETAGVERLRIDSTGDVGLVGIATATGLVVVAGSGVYAGHTGVVTAVTFDGSFTGNVTGAASQVTVADESSDTTCFPLFATAATGNLPPKSGTNLTFNSSTGALTATSFAGNITGGTIAGSTGTFTGFVDCVRSASDGFGYLGIGPGGTDEKAAFVNRSGEIDLELYSNYSSSATVSINSDGTAAFTGVVTLQNNLDLQDDDKILLGTGDDLEIFHDGSNSNIKDTGTGHLQIFADDLYILKADGSETKAQFNSDGNVRLFYDGVEKLATKTDGVDITGELQCDSLDVDGAATIDGNLSVNRTSGTNDVFNGKLNGTATSTINADGSAEFAGNITLQANLDMQDDDKILLGTGDDLEIYHDGSNSYVADTGTGNLKLVSNGSLGSGGVEIIKSTSENMAIFKPDDAVELYYDNAKKFETKTDGVDITGELQCDSLDVDGETSFADDVSFDGASYGARWDKSENQLEIDDNAKIVFGTGADLKIYHNGSVNYIAGDEIRVVNNAVNETMAKFIANGAVELFHNDSIKLATSASGVSVTGDMTASGNVTAYSDISLKENIETIPNALDKVLNLRGVEFDRIDKEDNPHEIGVIAQEVEEVIPEVVLTNTEGIKSVAYGNLVGLLIESIKELKAEVNDLKAQVEG